ncbi:MAG: hypothetical protein GY720_14145 [bacterium]|nr:hypothetical protein [bacterium]
MTASTRGFTIAAERATTWGWASSRDFWPLSAEARPSYGCARANERLTVGTQLEVDSGLANPRVNIRTLLAVFWICHFILWIFGDMFTLVQEMSEPATDTAVQIIAPTTAIVLTLMVVFCLVGPPAYVRLANLILAPVYLLLNIGFFVDATQGWEYYLGLFYVFFNVLIFWYAYKWPQAR